MWAGKRPPVFELSDRSAFFSVTWCAGAIAHDSFHSKLYHDYKRAHWLFVPSKVWKGHEVEVKCIEHQLQVLKEIGAPDSEVRWVRNVTPEYADVAYWNRNW